MKIEDVYKREINDLIIRRGSTKFHITGIRHCDYKDKADDFIRKATQRMQNVMLLPEEANQYDQASVVCRSGNKKIGYVSVYDLEKYQILARKEDSDHLTGHFFFGNTGDHLLDLSVAGIVTLDDIRDYRKEVDKQKKEQYGSWKHDAIKRFLVHSRHQDDAKACIIQMKEFTVGLFGGYGSTTLDELSPKLEQYKESSQYDISLEGQRDRWDILRYLDYLYDRWHMPGTIVDKYFEDILVDVSSQIGGELGRNVSYTAYIDRLTELVTTDLPSSEAAKHYLKMLPHKAFDDIRQQVENFPHQLYHLFHTDPREFVRTIYYARIPRKYLDPFLSGIALLEAYNNLSDRKTTEKTKNNKKNVNMGGLIRYGSNEAREEYARKMNNSLREYNKIARNILERNVPAEIEGLIEDIEKGEWMLHFDKMIVKEFDYTSVNDKGLERKIHGPWDYETYCEMFENPGCREQIEEMLKKEPYKKQDILIEEYEIQCLHSALKTELARAQKVVDIKKRAQGKGSNNTLNGKPQATKSKTKPPKKKPTVIPKTLKYYKHGNKGQLMKQRKRVDIIFKKWNEWKWIDDKTTANDFDSFFEGEPKHCNIIWMANTTILTILLQELIEQPYIEKQTGVSAKLLVKGQFEKTPSSDRKRIDDNTEDKIRLTLLILDTRNPLPERNSYEDTEEFDISDAALMEIFAGQLHLSKSV